MILQELQAKLKNTVGGGLSAKAECIVQPDFYPTLLGYEVGFPGSDFQGQGPVGRDIVRPVGAAGFENHAGADAAALGHLQNGVFIFDDILDDEPAVFLHLFIEDKTVAVLLVIIRICAACGDGLFAGFVPLSANQCDGCALCHGKLLSLLVHILTAVPDSRHGRAYGSGIAVRAYMCQ